MGYCNLLFVVSHLFLLLFIHECTSCPWPIHFKCNGDEVLPPPFHYNSVFDCGQCNPSCNDDDAALSCRPDDDKVLYISSTNDTIVGFKSFDPPIKEPCIAYYAIVLEANSTSSHLPSWGTFNFTLLDESDSGVYVGCPHEAPNFQCQKTTCDDQSIIYGPFKKGLPPPPPDCIQFRKFTRDHNFSVQFNIIPIYPPPSPPPYTEYPDSDAEKHHLRTIVLSTVLPGFVVISIILAIYWRRPNSKSVSVSRILSRAVSLPERTVMNGVTIFPFAELQEATNNFDYAKELGEGGFGIVYHGKLRDGREVAVKRMYERNFRQVEQFNNEIRILTSLQHPNLVTLYGCTSRHSRELLLVYEYVPNKTLADHLHGDQALSALLSWTKRMTIAIETATALAFLHFKEVIHRDIKTDNILLDNTFRAKVADFGLSRLFPADVSHISTGPMGTPGYLDPEYRQCYHLSDKSDVYSFGVVLIELISSLPAVDLGRHRHEVNLSNYAMNKIQSCAFGELVDAKLGFETDFKVRRMTTLVAELAFRCLQPERELRPSMEEVLEELKSLESADYEELEAEEVGYEK